MSDIKTNSNVRLVVFNPRFAYDNDFTIHTGNADIDQHVHQIGQDLQTFAADMRKNTGPITWVSLSTALTAEFSKTLGPLTGKPPFVEGGDYRIGHLPEVSSFGEQQQKLFSDLRGKNVDTLIVCGFFAEEDTAIGLIKNALDAGFKIWLAEDLMPNHETDYFPLIALDQIAHHENMIITESGKIRNALMKEGSVPEVTKTSAAVFALTHG